MQHSVLTSPVTQLSVNRQRFVAQRHLLIPTPTQQVALWLYERGFNVSVQPYGRKQGFPHRGLQFGRLYHNPDDPRPGDLLDVTRGRCNLIVYTGRTSRNLLVIDCETHESFVHIERLHKAMAIQYWSVQSPSNRGGGHFYLRCRDGEVENVPTGTHRDIEIRANRNYVMAVGSKHPNPASSRNQLYQWAQRSGQEVPEVSLEQLRGLTDPDGRTIDLRLKYPHQNRAAPIHLFTPHNSETREFLLYGSTLTEGARRASLFDAACDYARCNIAGYTGYSIQDAYDQLAPIARASGLSDAETARAIGEAYTFVTKPTYKAQGKPAMKSFDWQYALVFSELHTWTGRASAGDRAVFLALIERARLGSNQNGTFRASVREIAEYAHVNRNTAHVAIRRLQHSSPPLICYAGEDGNTSHQLNSAERRANLWRFSDYVISKGRKSDEIGTVRSTINGLSSSVLVSSHSDIAERGALGAQGLHIYQTLLTFDQPATLKEVAERAHVTVRQARYHIVGGNQGGGKLLATGLVVRDRRLYTALPATPDILDQLISVPYGTAGKSERRIERHRKERGLYMGAQIVSARYGTDRRNFAVGDQQRVAVAAIQPSRTHESESLLEFAVREWGAVITPLPVVAGSEAA